MMNFKYILFVLALALSGVLGLTQYVLFEASRVILPVERQNPRYEKCYGSFKKTICMKEPMNYNEKSINNLESPDRLENEALAILFIMLENNNNSSNDKGSDNKDKRDVIDAQFYNQLPSALRETSNLFDREGDKLTVLLGNLSVLSGVLIKTYGIYDSERLYPNLYLFVVGRASSGKGKLAWSKRWITPINDLLSSDTSDYNFIIPANNSSEGFLELLGRNEGSGILFETEGDTIANTLKKDYGNYSDLLRKGFHHEEISSYRKTNDRLVRIEFPKISTVLSGTPNQVHNLIPSAENGLFSRFLFHSTESNKEFINVFAKSNGETIQDGYAHIVEGFTEKYESYLEQDEIEFSFTDDQKGKFLELLSEAKAVLVSMVNEDLDATANRMGCNFFRIAMVLTQLRAMESGNSESTIVCSNEDFESTRILVAHLINEAVKVFNALPSKEVSNLSSQKFNIYRSLEDEFTTAQAKAIGEQHSMSGRNVQRFLSNEQLFEKLKQGEYRKKVRA